ISRSLRFVLVPTVSDARGSPLLLRNGLAGTKAGRLAVAPSTLRTRLPGVVSEGPRVYAQARGRDGGPRLARNAARRGARPRCPLPCHLDRTLARARHRPAGRRPVARRAARRG